MTLGERIRQEREQCGISQAELARRIGVSKNTMNMIEESKIADPRFSRVLAIARQLDMSLDALVRGASPPASRQATWAEGTGGAYMIPLWRCSRQHQGGLPTGSRPVCERGRQYWKTAIDRGLAASGRHHVDMQKGA